MIQIMPLNQHRIEIYRVVELLNDFYAKVIKTREKHLIIDVERIIRAFKSKFFQALIDIQEYYEITVVDHRNYEESVAAGNYNPIYPWNLINHKFIPVLFETMPKKCEDQWEIFEMILKRQKTGLGFSIAGGTDNQHFPKDSHIYITKIIPGGAAAEDGRLQINDIIEKVNHQSMLNMNHSSAVSILNKAGADVNLRILRRKNVEDYIEIELLKSGDGFGFSIAGGKDNQHLPGENGIYITKILEGGAAHFDGHLEIGDKLVGIRNYHGIELFDDINHQQAVELLKNAEEKITLIVRKSEAVNTTQKSKCNSTPKETRNLTSDQPTTCRNFFHDNEIGNLTESEVNQNSQNTVGNLRQAHLRRGQNGFGFNIVGGEDGDDIYISSLLEGGPASTDGTLKRGDKILIVNGISFKNMSHDKAAAVLKGSDRDIDIVVQNDAEGFEAFEKKINHNKKLRSLENMNTKALLKTNEKKYMHVRALFTYDPNKDEDLPSTALSFTFGDVLNVTNASDEEWWVATKISSVHEKCGIIPSRKRWERKQRARDRTVKFEGYPSLLSNKHHMDKRKKNYSFSRKFPFMKNKDDKFDDYPEQEPYMLCYTESDAKPQDASTKEILYRVELPYMEELTLVYLEKDVDEEGAEQLCGEENILSYEEVELINISYTRPIVILGPIKDKINDDLISRFPEKFASCVPHTTRSKREDEMEGRDYYFIKSRDEMEFDIQNHLFIEAGQYNENLYGTSISSVEKVAQEGKHCILDVSGNAIKRLYAARLYPIALFIRVKSPQTLMEILRNITEDQAKMLYCRSLKIEQDFSEHFTGIIEGDNYEEIYEQIMQTISRESGNKIWIPCKYRQV